MDIKYIDKYNIRYCPNINISIPFSGIFDESIVYHSNNGYDYVLLNSNNSKNHLYKIDEMLCWYYKRDDVISHTFIDHCDDPRFKVIHIDGNSRNNSLDNLKVEVDIERWMSYDDICAICEYLIHFDFNVRSVFMNMKKDGYDVSHNDIFFIKTKKCHKKTSDEYFKMLK